MEIKIESRPLDSAAVLVPQVFEDGRGFFMETFRVDQFKTLGLPTEFVQDNHSRSKKGVLRGLHFQWEPPMGKLMRVTYGSAFLVAVDIRKGSPTLGRWLENDPLGLAGGDTNLYRYVGDSPTLWIDPSGLSMVDEEGNVYTPSAVNPLARPPARISPAKRPTKPLCAEHSRRYNSVVGDGDGASTA